MITIEELLRKASSSLQKVSDTSRLDAEVLLSHSVGLSRLQLITEAKVLLTDAQVRDFEVLLERRLQRQPVAYIVGSRFFWDLEFEVSPDVLVPRPETEHLVEQVLVWARSVDPQRHLRILELGVGSGCIAVSVAREMKREQRDFRIIAVDSSGAALEIARRNCERHSVLDCIQLLQSNWFEALDSSDGFDCIVSNPPYVADLAADLSPETRYEPPQALFAGPDGLSDLENILKQSPRWIRPGGVLLCEIGRGQASALKASCDKMSEYLGAQTLFVKDYAGVDRIFRVLFSSQEQSSQKFPGAWNEE